MRRRWAMRFAITSMAILLASLSPAYAQITNCTATGPFLNCHTMGGNTDNGRSGDSGGSFWEAFRSGQQARREGRAEQQQSMLILYRMVQQANAEAPANATPEESLAIRSEALDRIHMILRDSGVRIDNWRRVMANLLAHPELADQALGAMAATASVTSTPSARVSAPIAAQSEPQAAALEAQQAASATPSPTASRCPGILAAWNHAMQQGDHATAQRHMDDYRLHCR